MKNDLVSLWGIYIYEVNYNNNENREKCTFDDIYKDYLNN